ncbi:MAG: aspartate carbamoyltransferase catalytic subunit [bacterium]
MFKNLIDIKNLDKSEITEVIDLASGFEKGITIPSCKGKHLALIFCENSTRTRFSFEMAANKLGIHNYNFDANKSSFSKGESMKDTIENLWAIGIEAVVIRHSESGIVEKTIQEVDCPMAFINGGDGNNAHPTQALLDFYTIQKHLGSVENKKIAMIGDIRHSRVAKSNIELLKKFGAKIHLCAPEYFIDDKIKDVIWTNNLKDALKKAAAAIFLRVQNERLEESIPLEKYIENYGLTLEKLQKFAPKDILIMHPGPVNRGVELSSEIIDGKYGKIILEQAHNGVFVRMAVLELLLGGIE